MIEIMRNGEINPKKLTKKELDVLVDMKLDYYKQVLKTQEKEDEVGK